MGATGSAEVKDTFGSTGSRVEKLGENIYKSAKIVVNGTDYLQGRSVQPFAWAYKEITGEAEGDASSSGAGNSASGDGTGRLRSGNISLSGSHTLVPTYAKEGAVPPSQTTAISHPAAKLAIAQTRGAHRKYLVQYARSVDNHVANNLMNTHSQGGAAEQLERGDIVPATNTLGENPPDLTPKMAPK